MGDLQRHPGEHAAALVDAEAEVQVNRVGEPDGVVLTIELGQAAGVERAAIDRDLLARGGEVALLPDGGRQGDGGEGREEGDDVLDLHLGCLLSRR